MRLQTKKRFLMNETVYNDANLDDNKSGSHNLNSNDLNKDKKVKVVIEKNYKARNLAMSIFSLPLLLLVSTVLVLPAVLFGFFSFSTGLILTIISEITVVLIALSYTDSLKNFRHKLRLHNFTWKSAILGLGLGVVAYGLLQGLAYGFGELGYSLESSDTSVSLGGLAGWERVLLLYFAAPFLVPFIEEIFFRGYTLGFAQDAFESKKKGIVIGLIISTLAFGIAHYQGLDGFNDIFLMCWTGAIGLTNALLMIRFNSIFPGLALHVSYNGITVLMTIIASL